MNRAPFLGVALLATLMLASSPDPETTPQVLPLCILGDSIGVGISQALAGMQVPHNMQAKVSTNARQWAEVIRQRLPPDPHLVVMSLGTNDGQSDELRAEFRHHVAAIAQAAKAGGHRLIWVLPPGPSPVPSEDDWRALADEHVECLRPRVAMADKWHPNTRGYQAIADQILNLRNP